MLQDNAQSNVELQGSQTKRIGYVYPQILTTMMGFLKPQVLLLIIVVIHG